MIGQDIAPYSIVQGDRARLAGLNLTGLKRRGFSPQSLTNIKKMYKIVFRSNLNLSDAVAQVEEQFDTSLEEVATYLDFLKRSERGLAR